MVVAERPLAVRLAELAPDEREYVLGDLSGAEWAALERDLFPPEPELRLREYVREMWPVVEPETPFIPGWHLDCIAEHLEACTCGDLLNLVINIPPRHAKSLTVAVAWPTWEWTFQPHIRWVFNSYAESLSVRDSLKCRRVIQSRWYQGRWGHVFRLTGDQNQKTRFDNDHTGYRIAASVTGGNTGEGGSRLVADDPHNVQHGESAAALETARIWWSETMPSRRNDPKTAVRVIVMQRVNERDVAGYALAEMTGFHHLCLPAEYEPRVTVTVPQAGYVIQPHDDCPIYADPRTDEGALLWPDRFSAADMAQIRKDLGTYAYASQYQQRPAPRAGALFRSEWFRPLPIDYDRIRPRLNIVQFYDLAWSESASADYTACLTVGIDPQTQNLYLLNAWRTQTADTGEEEDEADIADPDLIRQRRGLVGAVARQIKTHRPVVVGIEEGAFQQAATKDFVRRLARAVSRDRVATSVLAVKVTKDKVFRAQLPAGRAEGGFVFVDKSTAWWQMFEAEVLMFPKGAHDDLVDALSGAVQLAIEKGRPLSRKPRELAFGDGQVRQEPNDPHAVPRAIREDAERVMAGLS